MMTHVGESVPTGQARILHAWRTTGELEKQVVFKLKNGAGTVLVEVKTIFQEAKEAGKKLVCGILAAVPPIFIISNIECAFRGSHFCHDRLPSPTGFAAYAQFSALTALACRFSREFAWDPFFPLHTVLPVDFRLALWPQD